MSASRRALGFTKKIFQTILFLLQMRIFTLPPLKEDNPNSTLGTVDRMYEWEQNRLERS